MKEKTIQTELFVEPKPEPVKLPTFARLNIHQKINYKANKCGFGRIVYLTRYNYYCNRLIHRIKTDSLSADYYEHYKLNSGNGNRLDRWRKENIWI